MLRFFKQHAILISLLLVLFWAVVIYCFSAADASNSSKTSSGVTYFLCNLLVPGFKEMSKAERLAVIRQFSYQVRKTAHFTEYLIFGFLLYVVVFFIRKRRPVRYGPLLAWLTGTLYAVSDEIHQYFVPGRAMMLFDIIIDSAGTLTGVAFGCLFFALLSAFLAARQKNKSQNSPNLRQECEKTADSK